MRLLYLDDSGKIHANDPAKIFMLAGFSVDEGRWHTLIRQINGAKAEYLRNRESSGSSAAPAASRPYEWEMKSTDFLSKNAWKRGTRRKLCFSVADILARNRCFVYGISLEKAKANDQLEEGKFFPLAFQRLIAKFNDEATSNGDTGSVICDWSTHQLDHLICMSITGMVVTNKLESLRGGVTYGSSAALAPLQVADLISGTLRRNLEGHAYLDDLADRFRGLRYTNEGKMDHLGYPVNSVIKVF